MWTRTRSYPNCRRKTRLPRTRISNNSSDAIIPRLYGLPKAHKHAILLRFIVSFIGLATYNLSSTHPLGMTLPRTAWVRLSRLRTNVECFRSCLYKWGMASSAACECGAEEQTVDHAVLQCPIHRPPHGLHDLTVLDDETIGWLLNTCPEI